MKFRVIALYLRLSLKSEAFISDLHKALHSWKLSIFTNHSNWSNKKNYLCLQTLLCLKQPQLLLEVQWHASRFSAEAEGQKDYKQLKPS